MRLIAISSLAMLLFVVLTATALIIAWGLVVASVLQAVASTAVPWSFAAVALALGHVLLATFCWQRMTRLSRHLTMPALRHAIRGDKEPT
jgi:hypothetical protein